MLKNFEKANNQSGLTIVNAESLVFAVNLLANYCKFGTSECLASVSMRALIQAFCHLYSESRHSAS